MRVTGEAIVARVRPPEVQSGELPLDREQLPESGVNLLRRSAREHARTAAQILLSVRRAGVAPDVSPVLVRINAWVREHQLERMYQLS